MRDYQPAPAVMKTRRHDNMVMWKANVGNINLNGTEYYSCYSVIGTHHLATFKGSSKMMNKAVREGRLSGFSVGTSTGDHLQLLDLSSVDLISKGNACISSRRNAADNFLNKVFKIWLGRGFYGECLVIITHHILDFLWYNINPTLFDQLHFQYGWLCF
ncbi:uncharacterized protein LOC112030044 isoform X1 [Quercus suber]|uniref:uncharacterized protein LOC112030044 isoform X1 n=1 Tax=Quercus suber TaxID=58331 RepID=UPI0032DE58A7